MISKVLDDPLSDRRMGFYADQAGAVFFDIEPGQCLGLPEFYVQVKKIDLRDVELSQEVIEPDGGDLSFF